MTLPWPFTNLVILSVIETNYDEFSNDGVENIYRWRSCLDSMQALCERLVFIAISVGSICDRGTDLIQKDKSQKIIY